MYVETVIARTTPSAGSVALRDDGAAREAAIAELHELLLRGAHVELNRRRASLVHVSHEELDDLAVQAADDALVAVLAKLDTFRGASRFTTWAYKFVAPRGRREGAPARVAGAGGRARRGGWPASATPAASVQDAVERAELLRRSARRYTPR